MERPAKRSKLMSDDEDSESDAGVQLPLTTQSKPSSGKEDRLGGANGFKVNSDFAKRFEHNKKREELQQLQEKYKKTGNAKFSREAKRLEQEDEDGDSSSDESEDDEADLVTADLDNEIMSTLQAIKNKDPRVYDTSVKFYRDIDAELGAQKEAEKKEKPMYLQDYHRQNLLAGHAGGEDEEEYAPPQTYQQEQDALKRQLVGEMHAANGTTADFANDDEDDFMVTKKFQTHAELPAAKTKSESKKRKLTDLDIKSADQDPETYLSNFMAARAWRPTDNSKPYAAFDSDDSEEDARADAFEEAYNLRFEDPALANERLQYFARDVSNYSVRRDDKTGRARQREREREHKEAAKREREEERARLKKLKVDDAEEKVQRIKEAAGLRNQELDLDEWRDIIEGDFDDEQWAQAMNARFGEKYYAENEGVHGSDEEMEDAGKKKRKVKKPTFDDDLDIKDLVPEFEEEDARGKYTLSSSDEEDGGAPLSDAEPGTEAAHPTKKPKNKKDHAKQKADSKRIARKERRKIEDLVDASLPLAHPQLSTFTAPGKAPVTGFRYRDTSPTDFGLSARDILFADDSQLNQYAGLKKMAPFREEDRKQRDRKKFSKKGRLKQWRKDTFGRYEEPKGGFETVLGDPVAGAERPANKDDGNVNEGQRKKKRSRKNKSKGTAT